MDSAEQVIYMGVCLGGRYRVTQFIGSGNFSGVFRATDDDSGQEVAVKILSFRSGSLLEARLEFDGEKDLLQTLAGCSHVVNAIDHGSHPLTLTAPTGTPLVVTIEYVVLELADACLSELLLFRNRLPWSDRLRLFRDIVKGVHQMHLRQVVHRDIKADNSLVFSDTQSAKIADLGRSKDTSQPSQFISTAYAAGRGDLRFAPPEFIWLCGGEDAVEMARADLYLLGSLLFELATGFGITTLALPDATSILNLMQPLTEAARRADLVARHRELLERYLPTYELFGQEVPPPLRDRARSLLATLTDPDPKSRVPGFRRSTLSPWDLEWVLHGIDVLLKIDGFS